MIAFNIQVKWVEVEFFIFRFMLKATYTYVVYNTLSTTTYKTKRLNIKWNEDVDNKE